MIDENKDKVEETAKEDETITPEEVGSAENVLEKEEEDEPKGQGPIPEASDEEDSSEEDVEEDISEGEKDESVGEDEKKE